MLPNDRAQPAARDKPAWPARIMRWFGKAPLLIKVVLAAAAVCLWPLILPFTLLSSAVAVIQRRPGRAAAYATATWVFPVWVAFHVFRVWTIPLAILPFAVAWAAGTRAGPFLRAVPHHGLGHAVVPADRFRPAQVLAAPAPDRRHRRHPDRPGHPRLAAGQGRAGGADVRPGRGREARRLGPLAGPRARPPRRTTAGRFGTAGAAATAEATAASGPTRPSPPRCPTPSTAPATTRAPDRGRVRRSRSRTPWPNWTR